MNNVISGYLWEMFISHQGEGVWVGYRQLFIRLAGCAAQCCYCDTPESREYFPKQWSMREKQYGKGLQLNNPVTAPQIVRIVQTFNQKHGPLHSISITGGEPLEQPEFLEKLLINLKKSIKKIKILLETNGLRDKVIKRFDGLVNMVVMDFKLESTTGQKTEFKKHERFLSQIKMTPGCIKVVVGPETTVSEVVHAAKIAVRTKPQWDFILQPVTGARWNTKKNLQHLDDLSKNVFAIHPRTRVIPQIHRFFGIA